MGPPNIKKLKEKGDVKGLIKALRHEEVGSDASTALAEMGESAFQSLGVALTADQEERVRLLAARALGKMRHAGAIQLLVAALTDDPEPYVRGEAAEGLGNIGNPEAVEPLIVALAGPENRVWRQAAEALGKIGDPRAVEPLFALFQQWEKWQYEGRLVTAVALSKFGDHRVVEFLITALKDEQWFREAAAEALQRIGGLEAERALANYRMRQ